MQVEQIVSSSSGALIQGPLLLTPRIFGDDRGFFFESWNQRVFRDALVEGGFNEADVKEIEFRQDNHSRSIRGVLRGLHYQLEPEVQEKLVRCTIGAIFDVIVDLRRSSGTFGHWAAAELTAENHQQLWVPVGFAHGFLTLSEHAEILYKTTNFWDKGSECSVLWNDSDLAIDWPLTLGGVNEPLLSKRDAEASSLAEVAASGDLFA